MEVFLKGRNFIDTKIYFNSIKKSSHGTWVYAPNEFHDRQILWKKLVKINRRVNGTWMVAGDFNDLSSFSEKEGGVPHEARKVLSFREMMDDCGLRNRATKGVAFTWWNKRSDAHSIRERIDRVMINVDWLETFPMSIVNQLPLVGFDHAPLVLQLCFQDKKKMSKAF